MKSSFLCLQLKCAAVLGCCPELSPPHASPPPQTPEMLWWSAQTKGPTMCLLWCVQCQSGRVSQPHWGVEPWPFIDGINSASSAFALLFALNAQLSPWVLLTWCSGKIPLGWWWPVSHGKHRFSSVTLTAQWGQHGDYLLLGPHWFMFFFLPSWCFFHLKLLWHSHLTRNQLLFFNPIIGKLLWDNNSSLGTFNKSTRAKSDRFGYLFLSRIEQKLPLEPLESLPSSFPLLSPPYTLHQSSARVDEECVLFEW